MLSVSVYVLGDKGRTVATADYSAKQSDDVSLQICNKENLKGFVAGSKSDLFHFVPSGAVLFPDFYKAMLNYLEHSQRDYVVCPGLLITTDKKTVELRPDNKDFSFGQMIVKSWVVRELGDVSNLRHMSRRIISEYRGVEIPHCLYMEML